MQSIENLLQITIAGILVGCVYGLMCVGLGLIFGVMRIINFAQGDFLMLGMYGTVFVASSAWIKFLGPWSPFMAAVLMSPIIAIAAMGLYRISLHRLEQRATVREDTRHGAQLVITLGIGLIIQNMALMVFGTVPRTTTTSFASDALVVGPLVNDEIMLFINKARLVAAALALVGATLVVWFISRTRLGKSARAAADDRDAALYCGIDIAKIYMVVFGIGAGITSIAGGLSTSFYSFQPYVGIDFIIIMYAGVVLGGVGSICGAFLGGCIVGIVQQTSTLFLPQQLQNAAIFVVLLLVLLLRPQGVFGRQVERT
ncbi:branched-chain amino acid ABC transporter permease [soil metagenome]